MSGSNLDGETSGFTAPVPPALAASLYESRFTDLKQLYVSQSGYTRLFTATKFGKRYLLKTLKEEYAGNPVYETILAKEFEIGMRTDHPNIRMTIGFQKLDDLGGVIVGEYVDGLTLRAMLDRGLVTGRNARSLVRQLGAAIQYMHDKQIVHRDLKPENIMVSHVGGTVKLIDFSLADSEDYVIIKMPAGTRSYMAPELLEPGTQAGPLTDIYAFGLILAEISEAAGDPVMARLATRCTRKSPADRPTAIASLHLDNTLRDRSAVSRYLSLYSPFTTWLLVAILSALVAWLILLIS